MCERIDLEELDNILVRQKNEILSLISERRFLEAKFNLFILKELWDKCNYSYKYNELIERLYAERKMKEHK